MKKKSLKGLKLNKSQVSKVNNVSGGRAPYRHSDWCPTDYCPKEPDPTPETIPHSKCNNCGSAFDRTCGSMIGFCD